MAQPTVFKLKLLHTDDVVSTIADETSSISAYRGHTLLSHTDDPGGDIDEPGGVVAPPMLRAPSVVAPLPPQPLQGHLRRMSHLL